MIEIIQSENAVRIHLPGDLDATCVSELRPQIRNLIETGYRTFTYDFANTNFMCSAGLGLLVETYNRAIEKGGRIAVENLNPHLNQLLTDTKLLSLFANGLACDSTRLSALEAVQDHMSQELILLSYLNTITSSVMQADMSQDICVLTLEGVLRSLHCARGVLLLVAGPESAPVLNLAACEGFGEDARRSFAQMPLRPGSLERQCLDSMEAVHISSSNMVGAPPSVLLNATAIKDGILSPMAGRSQPLGLLLIEGPGNAPSFFHQSVPLVQVFSNVCGLALEKQFLLNDIQEKNAQLSRTLSELHKTQNTLMHAGKLAALGAISRGLGHSLNNKLVPIMGYTQMIRMQAPPESDLSKKVKIIETAAGDIKKIIDNMRAVARREELKLEPHDLREILDSALFMLDYLIRDEKILVQRNYATHDCVVSADRDRMVQAFLAILQRLPAAFSQCDRRNLRVEVRRVNNNVEASIEDNGRLINAEELEHVLDPFARETMPSEIDRFNLSIANGILKDHRGSLFVQQGENAGLRVTLQIPAAQARL